MNTVLAKTHDWDETRHPRAPAGGESGGEFVSAGVTAARGFEAKVRTEPHEHAQAFDRHGNALLRGPGVGGGKASGSSNAVFFTSDDIVRLAQKDAVFTHNHPAGTSLSKEDIDLALLINAREMRAVTSERVYVMRRRGDVWGFGGGKSLDVYNKHAKALSKTVGDRAALTHEVMTRTAQELGFDYAAIAR